MQGTETQSLVQEEPTCLRATKPRTTTTWPTCHNSQACEPQLLSLRAAINKACVPETPAPQQDKALQRKAHAATKE